MGTMNFLKGGYTGTLGQTYGVKQRRTVFVKAIPFSHTPHNKAQKDSFSAFYRLQRFTAQLNKTFWKQTGLSDKGRNRQNVLAEYFRGMVSDHNFSFAKVSEIIPDKATYTIGQFEYLPETQQFFITTNASAELDALENVACFIGVYVENGQGVGSVAETSLVSEHTINTLYTGKENAYAVAVVTAEKTGKRYFVTSNYKSLRSDIVEGETFFPNRMQNGLWFYVEPEIMQGTDVTSVYENEKLSF